MQYVIRNFPRFNRSFLWVIASLCVVAISRLLAPGDRVPALQAEDFFPRTAQRADISGVIEGFQATLRADPDNWQAYIQLGLAYLQRGRETGDPSYYQKAEDAFQAPLDHESEDYLTLGGMGMLALARHQFREALEWGERARLLKPDSAFAYGVIADAQVELGMYEEAGTTLQAMVDLRPDLSAYTRISYLRELYGDLDGALAMMQWAVDAGSPNQENTAWTRVQLGNLYFTMGDLEDAEEEYKRTLVAYPGYVYALAGLGKVQAARGNFQEAASLLERAIQVVPVPEFVIGLAEIYGQIGEFDLAREQENLLGVIQQLYEENGVDMDLEIALFNADRGIDLEKTLEKTRQAYTRRPGVYGADVLAWVLYQTGRYEEAAIYSRQALKLGSHQALFLFHAGMIEYRLGNVDQAESYLRQALEANPYFSIRQAPAAERMLETISPEN